jgi:hypothetical protein
MADTVKPPWRFWLVCILALIWNGVAAWDLIMSFARREGHYRSQGMGDAEIAYMNAMPDWMNAAWAVGVLGAVLGVVLLILRRRSATPVLVVSLVAAVVSVVYQFLLSNGPQVMGGMVYVSLLIAAVSLFLAWYAWRARSKGWLR